MAVDMDALTMSELSHLRWSAVRQRVRAIASGQVVADSTAARLVWEPQRVVGSYAVPFTDVSPAPAAPAAVAAAADAPPFLDPGTPFAVHTSAGTAWSILPPDRALVGAGFTPDDADLAGYIVLDWAAFDEWREEEKTVLAHPHDPFQRIDCLPSTRHVVVTAGGEVLAETHRPVLLLETHLPRRWYLPREDVRMDLLTPSRTHTVCAYKGIASYWSARAGDRVIDDVAWSYPDPLLDGEPVRDLLCFYDDKVTVEVDGAPA